MKNSSNVGFLGLLTIVFIVLKLTNHITWSWFWVLSPILFSIIIFLFLLVGIVIFTIKK